MGVKGSILKWQENRPISNGDESDSDLSVVISLFLKNPQDALEEERQMK